MGGKRKEDDIVEQVLIGLFGIIKNFFVSFYWGIRKLFKKPVFFIGLAVIIVISLYVNFSPGLWQKSKMPELVQKILFYNNRIIAIWYICCVGAFGKQMANEYETALLNIGFVGKDGKHPHFIKAVEMGKKVKLIFSSNIPLVKWKAALPEIETALDCNVLFVSNGKSKKIVELVTVPSECEIPSILEWRDSYCKRPGLITLGQGAVDEIVFDLDRTAHALVAGETGSGKSVILRCILRQAIKQGGKLFMIDFKGGVEFGIKYERYGEVVTTRERVIEILDMLLEENNARLKLFREMEVKNITQYNQKTHQNLCRIFVISDEIAEMLDKTGIEKSQKVIYEQIEARMASLARLSRATGIHLMLGMQRPDAKVLPGQIKNNIPVRVCGRFADKAASEIVLGNTDAANLPNIQGRFLFKIGNETLEFQAYNFDDKFISKNEIVSVGNMLIEDEHETMIREPVREQPTQTRAVSAVKRKVASKHVATKRSTAETIPEEKVSYTPVSEYKTQEELEKELRLMDEMDLNLNFGED